MYHFESLIPSLPSPSIQAGLDAPHLGVGIAAGEAASYEVYKDIMDIVIEGWHGYKPTDSHKSDMDYTKLSMTPEQCKKFDQHIVSTRIRAGRSIDSLALPPSTDRRQRRTVESLLTAALAGMTGDLAGKYYPLGAMTKQEEDDLQNSGFLFQKPTPNNVLANCGAARDWPDGRGIFHNKEKTFLVWVNEEDHMRCISMENGGNVKVFPIYDNFHSLSLIVILDLEKLFELSYHLNYHYYLNYYPNYYFELEEIN
jgi:creatine kinase